MRILFCGGGTAGHVYPNIAIAEAFSRNYRNVKVAYVTTLNGIENELVSFQKYPINVVSVKRKISAEGIRFAYLLVKSIQDSKKIIKEFNPDVIVGTGGYATFPVIYAGHKLGVKTILHESNLMPGKAIKKLENIADKILVNFSESQKYFKHKEKIIHTGNPIRQGYCLFNQKDAKERLNVKGKYVVLCFGGSLGAERINDSAVELIENFIRHRKDVFLFWASGKKDYNRCMLTLKEKNLDKIKNMMITDYLYDMPKYISSADVVICRAGAMTISEIALCGKCSVLIPSPNVANNHQYINAKALCDAQGANLLKEDEIYKLTDIVKELIENDDKRKIVENNARKFAKNDANKVIIKEILDII